MSIVVVGASANVAQLALQQVAQTIDPKEFTLITRNPEKLNHWADQGSKVVRGDATDRDLLTKTFDGEDQVLLVSGLNIGSRVVEHENVINAAIDTDIKHLTYTSVAGAHKASPVPSAKEHIATEMLLWDSGLSFAALRDQIYFEFFYQMLKRAARLGELAILGRYGRMAPVASSDITNCVACILQDPQRHDRVVYEITGPELFTLPEIAKLGEEIFGVSIKYNELTNKNNMRVSIEPVLVEHPI